MNWTKTVAVASFLFASASVWACGDDDPPPKDACPNDDPDTVVDESECRVFSTIQAGGTAVDKRGCKGCHGDDMSGGVQLTGKPEYEKTLQGLPVKLYPPNLTADAQTGLGSWNDDAVAYAIRYGIDKDSQALCPQMNHFSQMSDFEVYSIVMYLRDIPPVSKAVPRSVCPPTKEGQ